MECRWKRLQIIFCFLVVLGIFFIFLCHVFLALASKKLTRTAIGSSDIVFESTYKLFSSNVKRYETMTWVAELELSHLNPFSEDAKLLAEAVAADLGLQNLGQVGQLPGHFLFAYHQSKLYWPALDQKDRSYLWPANVPSMIKWTQIKRTVNNLLASHPRVLSFEQQVASTRVKRSVSPNQDRVFHSFNALGFNDPLFTKQWHLENRILLNHDMNVTEVWKNNITGRGITVAVIDDGLDWKNEDIKSNYNPAGSFDIVSNDDDPMPSDSKDTNHHGTRCAGEIAAVANNSFCGVGVAYGAQVAGIRLIDGPMTDEAEARAFTEKMKINDIYSCSWGPEDDGRTLDGPRKLGLKGLRLGTDYGRSGYGSIFIVASGNGGRKNDNCNYDGYANSIYTVTIGAVDEFGEMPSYSEECASMLAVAYSSGSSYGRGVVTTDWSLKGGKGCTENHSGTSAAAPLAAGIIALMLEARPCLTWRDVQYLIAVTAVKIDVQHSLWTKNAAGLHHSHQHGFGIIDAWRLVNAAKVWHSIPWLSSYSSDTNETNMEIRSGETVQTVINVPENDLNVVGLKTLEYVHLVLSLTHERRGDVEIHLVCPSGTNSILGAQRKLDDSAEGFRDWIFSTVRCWGERGHGMWRLTVIDHGSVGTNKMRGNLLKWRLHLYGSSMTSENIADRIRLIQDAASGEYLNSSFKLPCDPPPVKTKMEHSISEKYLKMLIVIGVFALIMSVYDSIDYALCHKREKEEHSKRLELNGLARTFSRQGCKSGDADDAEVAQPLLLPDVISVSLVNDGELQVDHNFDENSGCDNGVKKEDTDNKTLNETNVDDSAYPKSGSIDPIFFFTNPTSQPHDFQRLSNHSYGDFTHISLNTTVSPITRSNSQENVIPTSKESTDENISNLLLKTKFKERHLDAKDFCQFTNSFKLDSISVPSRSVSFLGSSVKYAGRSESGSNDNDDDDDGDCKTRLINENR